jgi:hypothetical protein
MMSIATNSRMLDRLIRVGDTGQCAIKKFELRLLIDDQQLSSVDTTVFQTTVSQANSVALK